ncbi:hypothetical protein Efla_000992 [Eimeria flavescens]
MICTSDQRILLDAWLCFSPAVAALTLGRLRGLAKQGIIHVSLCLHCADSFVTKTTGQGSLNYDPVPLTAPERKGEKRQKCRRCERDEYGHVENFALSGTLNVLVGQRQPRGTVVLVEDPSEANVVLLQTEHEDDREPLMPVAGSDHEVGFLLYLGAAAKLHYH